MTYGDPAWRSYILDEHQSRKHFEARYLKKTGTQRVQRTIIVVDGKKLKAERALFQPSKSRVVIVAGIGIAKCHIIGKFFCLSHIVKERGTWAIAIHRTRAW